MTEPTTILLRALLENVSGIRELLAQRTEASASSVQVNTSTRGWDITVKSYTGSDITPAGNAAVAEYLRVRQMLEDALMGKTAA